MAKAKPPKRKHAATPPLAETTPGILHKPEPNSDAKPNRNKVPFNLKLPEELVTQLRKYAARSRMRALDQGLRGLTMTDVIVRCVEEFLAREAKEGR